MKHRILGSLCAAAAVMVPATAHADRPPITGDVFVDPAGTCRTLTDRKSVV